ncbi:M23 family metallopeptidase [Phyllobacterium sp. 22552]|uniref:M23 family metallopeptidase n=1 Tax=Phyllobacterium sp. 22552 TaxID=3453941 RepID=UPI003F85F2E0
MKKLQNQRIFNGANEPHTIIVARGDTIRHFTLKPWMAIAVGTLAIGLAACYLLATSYLVFRDDLIHGSVARQARLQQAYEDRIAALRTQLDRVTSRQMLDQKLMEGKISELIDRQKILSEQNNRLAPVLQRASESLPLQLRADNTVPGIDSEESDGYYGIDPIITGPTTTSRKIVPTQGKPSKLGVDKAELLFDRVDYSLGKLETLQAKRLQALSIKAYERANSIKGALANAGITSPALGERAGTGGPLILANASQATDFESNISDLDAALVELEQAKTLANSTPIAHPVPGMPVSSSFGIRRDPLLGLLAFHSGMDFRAASGSSVYATAKGTVTAADYNGSYGNMIDLDHDNGLSTRYGHLSQILVAPGQQVNIGDVIGKAGSTGRSTGPHLHYEVRKSGNAVNPASFLSIGRQIAAEL